MSLQCSPVTKNLEKSKGTLQNQHKNIRSAPSHTRVFAKHAAATTKLARLQEQFPDEIYPAATFDVSSKNVNHSSNDQLSSSNETYSDERLTSCEKIQSNELLSNGIMVSNEASSKNMSFNDASRPRRVIGNEQTSTTTDTSMPLCEESPSSTFSLPPVVVPQSQQLQITSQTSSPSPSGLLSSSSHPTLPPPMSLPLEQPQSSSTTQQLETKNIPTSSMSNSSPSSSSLPPASTTTDSVEESKAKEENDDDEKGKEEVVVFDIKNDDCEFWKRWLHNLEIIESQFCKMKLRDPLWRPVISTVIKYTIIQTLSTSQLLINKFGKTGEISEDIIDDEENDIENYNINDNNIANNNGKTTGNKYNNSSSSTNNSCPNSHPEDIKNSESVSNNPSSSIISNILIHENCDHLLSKANDIYNELQPKLVNFWNEVPSLLRKKIRKEKLEELRQTIQAVIDLCINKEEREGERENIKGVDDGDVTMSTGADTFAQDDNSHAKENMHYERSMLTPSGCRVYFGSESIGSSGNGSRKNKAILRILARAHYNHKNNNNNNNNSTSNGDSSINKSNNINNNININERIEEADDTGSNADVSPLLGRPSAVIGGAINVSGSSSSSDSSSSSNIAIGCNNNKHSNNSNNRSDSSDGSGQCGKRGSSSSSSVSRSGGGNGPDIYMNDNREVMEQIGRELGVDKYINSTKRRGEETLEFVQIFRVIVESALLLHQNNTNNCYDNKCNDNKYNNNGTEGVGSL